MKLFSAFCVMVVLNPNEEVDQILERLFKYYKLTLDYNCNPRDHCRVNLQDLRQTSGQACAAFAPEEVPTYDYGLIDRFSLDMDLVSDTRQLITQLVENLRKSAEEALNSVNAFNDDIVNEATEIRDKMISDVQKFRQRVTDAVENVINRISNTTVAVKDCVDSQGSAAAVVFNETLSGTMTCVGERIADMSKEIQYLVSIANEAIATGSEAMEDMKKCTGDNANIWAAGSCLGGVAVKTKIKSVGFLAQSTLTIGRIHLAIASLPASLKVCAGLRLIETGIQTGKIIVEVGECSVTRIFNTITDEPIQDENEEIR